LRFPGDRITECVFGNHHAGIIIPENVKILNGFYRTRGYFKLCCLGLEKSPNFCDGRVSIEYNFSHPFPSPY
ncbi:MAG: hypothetical protein MJK14_08160, partial [Rivularia sp. ALOHA_DT_140]|nr:hypothetical protein [Rivularia sp. ALOHA_DT_140]